MNSLYRKAGNLIILDLSLSTEQKMSALGSLNLPPQLTYNKGIFMHKVLNNNSPNYLAQLFISHQSHYTSSRNNIYVPRPRLDLFKTRISFAGTPCLKILNHAFLFLVLNVIYTDIYIYIWTDLFESYDCLNILVFYRCIPMKEI